MSKISKTPLKTDYRILRESSKQWRSLLSAVVLELKPLNDSSIAYDILQNIGKRFATQTALPACNSLAELEISMCAVWNSMDWGVTVLEEHDGILRIIHHGADKGKLIAGSLSNDVSSWIPFFIAGVYQQWFSSMGANEQLKIQVVSTIDEFGSVEYQLSS
jgi:hypothetical protein